MATKSRKARTPKVVELTPKLEELKPVNFTVDTDGDMRPEPQLKRSDYVADIKLRWLIHQYEVKKLGEDLSNFGKFISQQTKLFTDKVYYTWCDM